MKQIVIYVSGSSTAISAFKTTAFMGLPNFCFKFALSQNAKNAFFVFLLQQINIMTKMLIIVNKHAFRTQVNRKITEIFYRLLYSCLLYTSDAADE